MRKAFASFDDVMIERVFQPLTDMMSDRIGISRGGAACFCLDLASVAWIVSQAPALSSAVQAWLAGPAMLHALLLLLGLVALTSLRTLFRRVGAANANPLRLAMRPHRAVVLLLLAVRLAEPSGTALGDLADLAMLACSTAALYLGACATPPPLRRRIEVLEPAV